MVQIVEASVEEIPSMRQPAVPVTPRSVKSATSIGSPARSAGSPHVVEGGTGSSPAFDRRARVRLFTFFEELAEPVKKLTQTAWAARGKLAGDVKSYTILVATMIISMPGRVSKVVVNPKLHELFMEAEDPQALAAVICGFSSALCLGCSGGVIGATVGGACGLALGAVPAIFTFGLSLPVGAVIGIVCGFGVGSSVGGGTGLGLGAASGMTVAYFSEDIKWLTLNIASRIFDVYDFTVVRPVAVVKLTGKRVGESLSLSRDYTSAKARAVARVVSAVATKPATRASALGAGAGGAALGTAGAASGALLGGTAGALVGVIPAIFTFGLSIPIGAIVGGSAGLCAGATAGTTVGFTGGGLAGYLAYSYKGVPTRLYNFAAGIRAQFA